MQCVKVKLVWAMVVVFAAGCGSSPTRSQANNETGGGLRVVEGLGQEVAVRVDGHEITEEEVEEAMAPMLVQLEHDYRDMEPDGKYDHSRRIIRGRAIEQLVTMHLVGREMEKHGIVVSDEAIDRQIEASASASGMTLEDLKGLVTSRDKQTFGQWKELMQYDKRIGISLLVEKVFAEDLEVSEAEAKVFYETYSHFFRIPEQVRVSHILAQAALFDEVAIDKQAEAAARTKAEGLLQQLRGGADFAALAKAHSDCPSGVHGGELGSGTRDSWVAEFSDAAFGLSEGQISGIVRTGYGYHIIKVSERKAGGVTSFEEVKDRIMVRLKEQRAGRVRERYAQSLRESACIEYAPGNLITIAPLLSL